MRGLQLVAWLEAIAIVVVAVLLWMRSGEAPRPIDSRGEAAPLERAASTAFPTEGRAPAMPEHGAVGTPQKASAAAADQPDATDDLGDDLGIVLHGTVLDSAGRPAEQAFMHMTQLPDGKPWLVHRGGSGSAYAVAGLQPGAWRADFRQGNSDLTRVEFTIEPEPRIQQRDFRLKPDLVLRVALLTPDGAPLQDAAAKQEPPLPALAFSLTIVASADAAPPELPAVRGRDSVHSLGSFENAILRHDPDVAPLPKRYIGILRFRQPPPLHVSAYLGSTQLATTLVEAGQPEAELRIDLERLRSTYGRICFRLLDPETGEPIRKCGVTSRSGHYAQPLDEAGLWTSPPLAPGAHDLVVYSEGYEPIPLHCDLGPGQTLDLGEMRPSRAAAARAGVLRDALGGGTSGTVSAIPLDGRHAGANGVLAFDADASGAFQLQRLGPRRHLLIGKKDAQMGWTVIDLRQPETQVEVRLRPTYPVTLENRLGPFDSYELAILEPSGFRVHDAFVHAGTTRSFRLPAGDYRAELRSPGRSARTIPFSVTPERGVLRIP